MTRRARAGNKTRMNLEWNHRAPGGRLRYAHSARGGGASISSILPAAKNCTLMMNARIYSLHALRNCS